MQPEFLKPFQIGYEEFVLLSGESVLVPKYFIPFKEWKGEPISNSYRKPFIDYKDEPLYAELVVLRMFQEQGWEGVWVDSYRQKYRTGLPETIKPVDLPVEKEAILASIRDKTGMAGGCWDVFIWKDDQILFLELKRKKKDAIKDSQRSWLEASLESDHTSEDFALIEWDYLERNSLVKSN